MAESETCLNDPLHFAVKNGHEEAVVSLLKQGRDPDGVDTDGWTPLHHACRLGFLSIAKLLLDHGASPSSTLRGFSMTALHFAAWRHHEGIVALLLRNGADVHAVDEDGYTALHFAADAHSENVAKLLLSYGADISAISAYGQTALAVACFFERPHVANYLIGCGADVHWVDTDLTSSGYTLLHHAAGNDMVETVQLLLDRRVDVDAVTDSGRTALHGACLWQSPNAVECLLQNGARISYTDRRGFTALHFVVLFYRSEDPDSMQVVELLFKYGADVNAEDEIGWTPFSLALQMSDTGTFKVFAQQLMKMKAMGLFVSENNLKAISEDEEAKSYSASCEAEIERMRRSAIGDSSVKIYDIFTKGANRLADALSNEGVHRVLESESYLAEFPIYAAAIRAKFVQGTERRDLLRKSSDWLWTVVSESSALPYVCVERINRCLVDADLALQIGHKPSQQEAVSAQL